MKTSISKIMKKAACVCAAALCSFTLFGSMAGCSSDTPKATFTISFNGENYTLNYRLFKKFFPKTVEHFTEVAKSGYYDGLCIHDYSLNSWYTGNYSYDKEGDATYGNLERRDYYQWMNDKGVSLTQSVFKYSDITAEGFSASSLEGKGLNTVYGEFENNGYKIKNNDKNVGAVNKEGSLVMYYYTNPSLTAMSEYEGKLNVLTKRNTAATNLSGDAKWYNVSDYCYNSATSLFYFEMTTSSIINKEYTVFGEPWDEKDSAELDKLQAAISSYIANNYESKTDDFLEETATMRVADEPGSFVNSWTIKKQFSVPKSPIVIEKVIVK